MVVAMKGLVVIRSLRKIVEGNHVFVTHDSPSINLVKDVRCHSPVRIQNPVNAVQNLLCNEKSVDALKTNKVHLVRHIVIQDVSL